MARDHGRERVIQVVDRHGGELHGRMARAQQRAAMLARHFEAFGKNIQIARNDQRRNFIAEQVFKALAPLLSRVAAQERYLTLADDLQPSRVKIIKKSDELKARAVDIRDGQDLRVIIGALIDDLHLKLFYDVLYADGAVGIHICPPCESALKYIHDHYNRSPLFLQGKPPSLPLLFSLRTKMRKFFRFFHLF